MSSSKPFPKIILSIETSAEFASVSLQDENIELYGATFFLPQVHANVIAPLIEKSLVFSGLKWSEIEAIAIGKGPGSYTGLRIATSVAKGICMARAIPLISVSSLENLANQAFLSGFEAEFAMVAIDARRNEVYGAIYDRALNSVLASQAFVLGDVDLETVLRGRKVIFAGSGANKTLDFFPPNPNWKLIPGIFPSAHSLGQLARKKVMISEFEDVISFEPDYLKPVFIRS